MYWPTQVLPNAGFMNLRNRTVPRASNASSGNRRFRTSWNEWQRLRSCIGSGCRECLIPPPNTHCNCMNHAVSGMIFTTSPWKCAKYCNQHVCMACPSLCSHISKTHTFKLHQIFWTFCPSLAKPSSNNNVTLYVLPVLWMTLCFHDGGVNKVHAQWFIKSQR